MPRACGELKLTTNSSPGGDRQCSFREGCGRACDGKNIHRGIWSRKKVWYGEDMEYETFEEHVELVRRNREEMRQKVIQSSADKKTKAMVLEWLDGVSLERLAKKYRSSASGIKNNIVSVLKMGMNDIQRKYIGYGPEKYKYERKKQR